MKRTLRVHGIALVLVLGAARVLAHVPLIHPSSGVPLHWSSPTQIDIVLQAEGSRDVPDASDDVALRLALEQWNAASGSRARFVEDGRPASRARRDYSARDLHLVLFDEDDASGYFPAGSATVALTTVWFSSSGAIQDADVLFNGAGFRFTTRGEAGRFDIADVATHELGHALGLDHTGAVGGTMYPYVDQGQVLKRSLGEDECAGLRDLYPSSPSGAIQGTVVRARDGSPVEGAYLVARDEAGRTRASILSSAGGSFRLRGLASGVYTVYARPLDGTVEEDNLGSGYRGRIETDFAPAFCAQATAVSGASTAELGSLVVPDDVALTLGSPVDTLPLPASSGASRAVFLHGYGLLPGCTLSASDPDLLIGHPTWLGTQVAFELTVPAGEEPGHVDLTVISPGGDLAVLPAAIEVTPPAPQVFAAAPGSGSLHGGDVVTIGGAGFRPGLLVVIGDRIYGEGLEVTRLDEETLRLTTAPTVPGLHDVVVIDACGVEGRRVDAFRVLSAPAIHNVLPHGGDSSGGTDVLLAGDGFLPGLVVRIEGVEQGPVAVESSTRARFTTLGGSTGESARLELENPDGARAEQAFVYAPQADPVVTAVSPDSGSGDGGTVLTIRGRDFTPTMTAWFYADPAGEAVPAAGTTFVDASTLSVTTPAHAAGPVSLLVADASACGVFAENAFTFSGGSGGGGACARVSVPAPRGPRAWLDGAVWCLAVLGTLWLRARSARGVVAGS